jgi:lysophospholipase L1-like esterase
MNIFRKKTGRFFCMILAWLGMGLTSCSKKNYTWSTEEEYYDLPIWKNHVRTYRKMNYPPHTAKVFIGDSMTEGFDLNRHFESKNLVNMGIGGDFTSGVIKRLKYATRLQPQSVFIMIGINDILKDVDMQRITSQYANILEILQSECPETFICVQSNLPTTMIGGSAESNKLILERVQELNNFLKTYCLEHGIYFADMYTLFVTQQGDLRSDCTYDGLHLSETGYLIWKSNIQTLVDK